MIGNLISAMSLFDIDHPHAKVYVGTHTVVALAYTHSSLIYSASLARCEAGCLWN